MPQLSIYFSLVAVRILPHCAGYIRKCLKENDFYYLNHAFEISSDGKSISVRKNLTPVTKSFFQLQQTNSTSTSSQSHSSPAISISAIVGKNGDGKSSIIEVIIRILNNLAYSRCFDIHKQLRYIEGLNAELYYRYGKEFYRIRCGFAPKDNQEPEIHKYVYSHTNGNYHIGKPLNSGEIRNHFFYTLVSNYSHYAYNTEDFVEEYSYQNPDTHWLHQLFHKNDAYQTPINLHPYRDKGNVDINRENLLSRQRLLITIAQSLRKSGRIQSTDWKINNKVPTYLSLKDIGFSKLQKYTIQEYLKSHKNENALSEDLNYLENYIDNILFRDNDVTFLSHTSHTLHNLFEYITTLKIVSTKGVKTASQYIKIASDWMRDNNLIEHSSDLSMLLDKIKRINELEPEVDPMEFQLEQLLKNWDSLKCLSLIQLTRLLEIFLICKYWTETGLPLNEEKSKSSSPVHLKLEIDPMMVFKDYAQLSDEEKCLHYIVYKTMSIFKNYPSYHTNIHQKPSDILDRILVEFELSEKTDLDFAFKKLGEDWIQKSHITLKLRQTYNFIYGQIPTQEVYQAIHHEKDSENKGKISFTTLSDAEKAVLSDIETLPPAIYKWDIIFTTKNDKEEIGFNSFSSGEKQKLYCQSAVIYHLQNINSIASETIHYNAVNLIFEEIELYFHPDWQRSFIYEMMELIRGANIPKIKSVNMIFVTHSPYILSDIPKSNVLFLKDGLPDYSMQENTFGANINSLLKNGFFLPSIPMGDFAYRKINNLFQILNENRVTQKNIDELYQEIMTVGEPAIRSQLMILLAPYRRLLLQPDEIDALIDRLQKLKNRNK